MARDRVAFPLPLFVVGHLLIYSDELSAVPGSSCLETPTGHPIEKHLQETLSNFSERASSGKTISAFRDFTEMRRAAAAMLNSAWGVFAVGQTITRPVGTRVVVETVIPKEVIWSGKNGSVRTEVASLACMVLDTAPRGFDLPFKIHTFYPLESYKIGRPRCEVQGFVTHLEPREP